MMISIRFSDSFSRKNYDGNYDTKENDLKTVLIPALLSL